MYLLTIDYFDIAGRSSTMGLRLEYIERKWRFATSTRENILQK